MSAARRISVGVAGALGAELIGRLAPEIEAAGFHALWVNDTPDGDAVAALAAAARTTGRLMLATGVVPVDRRAPEQLGRDVAAAGIPPERLLLGIGSGAAPQGSLARVRHAIEHLRATSSARIVVGALGPRMRRLGAERADGLVLNWLPPEVAAEQTREAHAVSGAAHVALYVRTALDPAAGALLEREAARYASIPTYAANFARLGVPASATTLPDPASIAARLPEYERVVDEVVLRAVVAGSDLSSYRSFVAGAAQASGLSG
ncbi:LLM class flavin-dependent oxidoreductase [Microbacterium sp. RD1]|uniref:LLM class flavin-dependent oxidoreductase n=1 Tax=Microbacterium sp. RD1 TaxID=3457313 RepID=UPI003FA60D4F